MAHLGGAPSISAQGDGVGEQLGLAGRRRVLALVGAGEVGPDPHHLEFPRPSAARTRSGHGPAARRHGPSRCPPSGAPGAVRPSAAAVSATCRPLPGPPRRGRCRAAAPRAGRCAGLWEPRQHPRRPGGPVRARPPPRPGRSPARWAPPSTAARGGVPGAVAVGGGLTTAMTAGPVRARSAATFPADGGVADDGTDGVASTRPFSQTSPFPDVIGGGLCEHAGTAAATLARGEGAPGPGARRPCGTLTGPGVQPGGPRPPARREVPGPEGATVLLGARRGAARAAS